MIDRPPRAKRLQGSGVVQSMVVVMMAMAMVVVVAMMLGKVKKR